MKKLKLFNEFYNGFEDYKKEQVFDDNIEFDYDEEFNSDESEKDENIDENINFFRKKRRMKW